jgi:hypothetical protein
VRIGLLVRDDSHDRPTMNEQRGFSGTDVRVVTKRVARRCRKTRDRDERNARKPAARQRARRALAIPDFATRAITTHIGAHVPARENRVQALRPS